jgi:hypothetical protein
VVSASSRPPAPRRRIGGRPARAAAAARGPWMEHLTMDHGLSPQAMVRTARVHLLPDAPSVGAIVGTRGVRIRRGRRSAAAPDATGIASESLWL